ncbi:MAG: hypothetical protein ACOX7H_06090 [Bacillota bacterium]|jgi:hypothetical protein
MDIKDLNTDPTNLDDKSTDLPEERDTETNQDTIYIKDIESTSIKHKINTQDLDLITEMQNIEQQLSNQNYKTYRKSRYWHQQNTTQDSIQQKALLQEVIGSLARIENILINMESLLKKLI